MTGLWTVIIVLATSLLCSSILLSQLLVTPISLHRVWIGAQTMVGRTLASSEQLALHLE
jgi:hypothetical protein